jgi:hypothetical protein
LPRLVMLVLTIRMSLWVMPCTVLRRLLRQRKVTAAFPPELVRMPVARLAWAVQVASRPVPAATCLTQSLALQFLLARSGFPSSVRIGVAKNDQRNFQAHAWVVCGDQVLLDNPEEVACYTALVSWEEEGAEPRHPKT